MYQQDQKKGVTTISKPNPLVDAGTNYLLGTLLL